MQNKQDIFKVPDGYFTWLEANLNGIPSRVGNVSGKERNRRRFFRSAPVLAVCSVCAVIALVLSFHFRGSGAGCAEDMVEVYGRYYAADLIPLTDPDIVFDLSEVADVISAEDMEDYLIWSDTSLAMIEQVIR